MVFLSLHALLFFQRLQVGVKRKPHCQHKYRYDLFLVKNGLCETKETPLLTLLKQHLTSEVEDMRL